MIATILIPLLFIGTFGLSVIVLLDSFLRARNCYVRLRSSPNSPYYREPRVRLKEKQASKPRRFALPVAIANWRKLCLKDAARLRSVLATTETEARPISPRFAAV